MVLSCLKTNFNSIATIMRLVPLCFLVAKITGLVSVFIKFSPPIKKVKLYLFPVAAQLNKIFIARVIVK